MKSSRGYEALRRRRVSQHGTAYFLTLCTRSRAHGLNATEPASAIKSELAALEGDQSLLLQGAVIMSDHVHVLGAIANRLTLGQIVGRLKAKTNPALRLRGISWQGNYYEHRMRPNDPIEDVIRYLYLNPYRAGLIELHDTYPWFWLGERESQWFRPTVDLGGPLPEWLA